MWIKIKESQRYADPRGPHLPQIDFIEGETVDVFDELALILIGKGHAERAHAPIEVSQVEPESKDEGVDVESKDAVSEDETQDETQDETESSDGAYDSLSPKKQLFVDEYLVDSDGPAAAVRAGYSESNADKQSEKLLADDDVQAAISEKGQ